MAQIKVLHYFFDLGVPARRRELRHICTHNPMPPRRRAFRSNDFGLKPTTIPRDAKRQAEPPSRRGTHSHQNHFRCNPSRMLVEPHTRFAASNAHPRLNLLPRRDFPAHAPIPGVAALPSSCPCRGCSRKTFNYYLSSIVPEGHPLNNPTQATKEHSVGRGGGTDILSTTPHKRRRSAVGWDDGTDILSTTPHKRRRSAVGWDDGTDTLSRRGSRHCSPRKGGVGKKGVVYSGPVPSCI